MSDAPPHPTPRPHGVGPFLLTLLAGLLVLLAGLTVVVVLPFILVLTAMGGDGGVVWPVYLWVPAVFLAGVFTIVAGLGAIADPRPRPVLLLIVLAIAAFMSFPPFWLSGS